jgi:MOSC domain-containing protein
MTRVAALYRYPVKGFTPEECETLTVRDDGRIAGDRVLGIRFADSAAADEAWSKKTEMLALMNTPGLARLHLRFDAEAQRLHLSCSSTVLADEVLNQEGRQRLATAVAAYVLTLDEHPLAGHPERLPLRVIGDGLTPRYHDAEAGQVTLHGRGSLHALTATLAHVEEGSERRFRSNIALEGLDAWEELRWVGRTVRIGTVAFEVVRPKVRCLATHANPTTGARDVPILTTLTQVFGQEKPTFGVAMVPSQAGGRIHVGDLVTLVE